MCGDLLLINELGCVSFRFGLWCDRHRKINRNKSYGARASSHALNGLPHTHAKFPKWVFFRRNCCGCMRILWCTPIIQRRMVWNCLPLLSPLTSIFVSFQCTYKSRCHRLYISLWCSLDNVPFMWLANWEVHIRERTETKKKFCSHFFVMLHRLRKVANDWTLLAVRLSLLFSLFR